MRKTKLSRFGMIVAVALVGAFAAAPMAVAQTDDPSSAQYNPPNIEEGTAGGGASGGSGAGSEESGLSASIGSLPFTGMDLLIIAAVALMLTGTGFALRRLSMPRDPSS